MDEDTQNPLQTTSLPSYARLPINRCNLSAKILGSLTFQRHPVTLKLDGNDDLHHFFFEELKHVDDNRQRALQFMDYMASCFLLHNPELAGLNQRINKKRNDYLRLLRGWHFDPDSKEAAVMKSWVESRFGLLTRNHHGPIRDFEGEHYQRYLADRSQGLYNSNALESQLDLLYAFNQFELELNHPGETHMTLYRGINRLHQHEILQQDDHQAYIILNNLSSFTSEQERADEFGDYLIECSVPLSKLLFVPGLLPEGLKGEQEYLVIGGVYQVIIH